MNPPRPKNLASHLAVAIALTNAASAQAQHTKFDGAWNVTMTSPAHNAADDDARGYTPRFPAEVQNGRIRRSHGNEGEPGWHFLHGKIHEDGSATLRLDGIVNNPKYAINDAQRGKEYTYRIKAQFQSSNGVGQRLTGRACEFAFIRSGPTSPAAAH